MPCADVSAVAEELQRLALCIDQPVLVEKACIIPIEQPFLVVPPKGIPSPRIQQGASGWINVPIFNAGAKELLIRRIVVEAPFAGLVSSLPFTPIEVPSGCRADLQLGLWAGDHPPGTVTGKLKLVCNALNAPYWRDAGVEIACEVVPSLFGSLLIEPLEVDFGRLPVHHQCLFSLRVPSATKVEVAGSFTHWQWLPLRTGAGVHEVHVALADGLYHYKYRVDGVCFVPEEVPSVLDPEHGHVGVLRLECFRRVLSVANLSHKQIEVELVSTQTWCVLSPTTLSLTPSATVQVSVHFAGVHSVRGTRTAEVVVRARRSDGEPFTGEIPVTADFTDVAGPLLKTVPNAIDFKEGVLRGKTLRTEARVINDGVGTLSVARVEAPPCCSPVTPFDLPSEGPGHFPSRLVPIELNTAQLSGGQHSLKMRFVSNSYLAGTQLTIVPIHVDVIDLLPVPAALDFGGVPFGTQRSLELAVSRTDKAPVNIAFEIAASSAGAPSSQSHRFTVASPGADTSKLWVTYTPAAEEAGEVDRAELNVTDSLSSLGTVVPLKGRCLLADGKLSLKPLPTGFMGRARARAVEHVLSVANLHTKNQLILQSVAAEPSDSELLTDSQFPMAVEPGESWETTLRVKTALVSAMWGRTPRETEIVVTCNVAAGALRIRLSGLEGARDS